MQVLRQSTYFSIKLGPFLDSSDNPVTNLTIANTDVKLSKNGGAFAAKNDFVSPHDENGYYDCILDTIDTDSVGFLYVACNMPGAKPVTHVFTIVNATIYNRFYVSNAEGFSTHNAGDVWRENINDHLTDIQSLGYTVIDALLVPNGPLRSVDDRVALMYTAFRNMVVSDEIVPILDKTFAFSADALENGSVDSDEIATSLREKLAALIVRLASPHDQETGELTLVASTEYKTGGPLGPLRFKLTNASVAADDAVRFVAQLNTDNGTEQIDLAGTVTLDGSDYFATFEVDAADLDVMPSVAWRYSVLHGTGPAAIIADKPLAVLPSRLPAA